MAYDAAYFSKYYQDNKKKISDRRKKKYKEDPAYRDSIKKSVAEHRSTKKAPKPQGYDFTFEAAADEIGVTLWTLRGWRDKSYFPEPAKHAGRMWFSHSQIDLLKSLKQFIDENGIRVGQTKRGKLEDMCNLIFANW